MDAQEHATEQRAIIDIDAIRQHRGRFLALGGVMIVLGLAAIAFPFAASLAVTLTVGAVLVIAGVAQLVHAFSVPRWRGFLVTLLVALLSLAVGTLVLLHPVSGVLSLTLLVGTFLVAGGAMKMSLAWRVRPGLSWRWLMFAGALAVLLGIVILSQWPYAAGWVLGVLVGIDLAFSGWWMVALALTPRRHEQAGAARDDPALVEDNPRRRAMR